MNLEKYDKYIWRVNGTLLLLACVSAIVLSLYAGYKISRDVFGNRTVHDIVNVDPETKKEEHLSLGYFHSLKGTHLFLVPLTSEQKYEVAYYSKSATSRARNYLVFDSSTKEGFWIWKSNSSLILDDVKIHDQIKDEKNQTVRGLVFELVEKDTNNDGVMNEIDQKSLQYFDLTTRKTVPVIAGIDRNIGVQQTSDDEILFLYSREGTSHFKALRVSKFELSGEKEIEPQP